MKYCTKRSKESNVEGVKDTLYRFQCVKWCVCRRRRRWYLRLYATLYAEYRFMSKMSKILCIQWPLAPPGGKACCSCPSCGFSGSPLCSPRRQLCKLSWTCQTTRVIAGKTHSQSPILKTKGCSATR